MASSCLRLASSLIIGAIAAARGFRLVVRREECWRLVVGRRGEAGGVHLLGTEVWAWQEPDFFRGNAAEMTVAEHVTTVQG